jgi:hypothetical protein
VVPATRVRVSFILDTQHSRFVVMKSSLARGRLSGSFALPEAGLPTKRRFALGSGRDDPEGLIEFLNLDAAEFDGVAF